jgi:hypothetical protein
MACKSGHHHANLVTPVGSEVLSKHILCIHEEAILPCICHLKDPMYLLEQIEGHSWFAIPKDTPSAC